MSKIKISQREHETNILSEKGLYSIGNVKEISFSKNEKEKKINFKYNSPKDLNLNINQLEKLVKKTNLKGNRISVDDIYLPNAMSTYSIKFPLEYEISIEI